MDIRQTAYPTRTSTLTVFFSKNNYNEDFNRRNTHRPTTTEANDNSYDHNNYTIHKGHIWEHLAHPTTIQYPRRSRTYYHTTSVTD